MHAVIRSAHTARRTAKLVRVKPTRARCGYTYRHKAGLVRVKSTPIPDVGAAGKPTSVIGRLKGGMLTRYGYHPVESKTARRRSLAKAVRRESPIPVINRLLAIAGITRKRLPTASRTYKKDSRWISENYLAKR
jgi:hypothetical protein